MEGPTVSFTCAILTIRRGKKNTFLDVYSGEGGGYKVQVVCDTKLLPPVTVQSFVRVIGQKNPLPQGVKSFQDHEIVDARVIVLSLADDNTIQACPPGASLTTQLEQRLFYFRDPSFVLLMKLHAKFLSAVRAYFEDDACMTEITPPSFTGVECEGGATLFKLKHPGRSSSEDMEAFLTQSSQFALEYMLPGVGDCYCIAPSFRAEHSHTRRHLTEFTHVECEWESVLTMEQHLDKLSHMLKGIVDNFLRKAKVLLAEHGTLERVEKLRKDLDDILVMDHATAIAKCREYEIYKVADLKLHFSERDDIPEAQERELIDRIGKVVFLVKFPSEFKSFYMALDPEDPTRVLGCDVEVPGVGEIVGSGVREADHDRLYQRLVDAGLKPDDYREYLDLRKSGFRFTSGMGLGAGRMLCWLLGLSSIREITAFPRFPGYLRP